MTNPIHDAVLAEQWAQRALRDAQRLVQRVSDYQADNDHPRPYDERRSHHSAAKEQPMSVLTDVEAKIHDVLTDVQGKLEDLVTTAPPVIHDASEALTRLSSSKIVVELEQLAQPIDPALEEVLAGMIRSAGAAAAKVAELTAAANPPAEAPSAPADAAPDLQVQTGIAV